MSPELRKQMEEWLQSEDPMQRMHASWRLSLPADTPDPEPPQPQPDIKMWTRGKPCCGKKMLSEQEHKKLVEEQRKRVERWAKHHKGKH